jgi:hypothetical protein
MIPPPLDRHAKAPDWVDPETRQAYPTSYHAYRRTRESQEKTPPRHCRIGPAVDHEVWRSWRGAPAPAVDIVLTMLPDAPPRVQRLVGEVLRAIRRGRPAGEAIRQAARRFGLRHARAQAFIAASITFEQRPQYDVPSLGVTD